MKMIEDLSKLQEIIKSESCILVGGFGLVGAPLTLIDQLTKLKVNNLTIVSNNLGEQDKGLGYVLNQNKIKKAIGSYFTSNPDVGEKVNKGELEIQLLPQGTLIESIRAGGAGIGGYYTKTGVGTELGRGKELKEIHGETYLFEPSITGDVALIKAHKADKLGNLVYYKTARNFNPLMATAAKIVIAEVDEIVEIGELSPEEIVTPHLYVDYIITSKKVLTNKGVVDVG